MADPNTNCGLGKENQNRLLNLTFFWLSNNLAESGKSDSFIHSILALPLTVPSGRRRH
jgi:hypothetical protein